MSTAATSAPGLLEIVRGVSAGTFDAAEHLRSRLLLADEYEPWLHAFVHRPAKLSLPNQRGPLGSVPVGVKDIVATADMPTTNGSPLYRDHRPTQDAAVVRRLRALGGLVFGKTVTTEFAWRHPGPTVNPYCRSHTPGGSSSGSAAAVAAGIVPLALGTQTVGSIIRPAAFCGVVGLKPSFATISLAGVHPFASSLDHLGLFARSTDDVAYALSMLASPKPFVIDIATGLADIPAPRLLLVRTSKWQAIDDEQQGVLTECARRFAGAGATIKEAALPNLFAEVWHLLHIVLAVEAASRFGELVDAYPDRTSAPLQQIVAEGRAIPPRSYAAARAAQTTLRHVLDEALRDFDALLMVPAPGEAPRGLANTGDATFCAPWSFTGVPAITLPVGWSHNSLPLGLQLVGAWQQDLSLLRVAKWAEQILQWRSRPLDVPDRQLGTPAHP